MSASVVVLGDALLDVDIVATASRFVPDCVAPVLVEREQVSRAGGAALAARLLAERPELTVTLVTPMAADPDAARLRAKLDPRIRLVPLPGVGATAVKTRLRCADQTVARLDRGGAVLRPVRVTAEALAALAGADAILVSDYGRGTTRDAAVRAALGGVARSVPIVWDPHPRGGAPVAGVRLLTPNAAEAAADVGGPVPTTLRDAADQAARLQQRRQVTGVVVTVGSAGAVLSYGGAPPAAVPADVVAHGDACGAGDAFAAAVTAELAGDAVPSEAVAAAVGAAGRFVAGGGVSALDGPGAAPGAVPPAAGDGGSDWRNHVARVRAAGGTVVATGGCFDLVHAGHTSLFAAARAMGDCLLVCVNSDSSVRRLKGPGRPIQSQHDRIRVLQAFADVDAVVCFDEDTPMRALDEIRPDVWVKGGDYSATDLPEEPLVRSWGGRVLTVPYLAGRSTTALMAGARP